MGDAGADPASFEGKPKLVGGYERTSPSNLPGYWRRHANKRGSGATREAPAVIAQSGDQLAARERQAGPSGVTERLAVLMKPGNSGGGKGPQLKGNARSDEGPRD
jgi:hypothetical protein